MSLLLALLFGYLLGSIPFGLLITRAAGGPDVRTIGSGNIGATNVLRTGRKGLAAATLVCDMLKGTVAVLRRRTLCRSRGRARRRRSALSSATCFRCGSNSKAARASPPISACCIGLYWPAALDLRRIWLVVAALFRYSSLAALVASALTPLELLLLGRPEAAALFLPLTDPRSGSCTAPISAASSTAAEGKIGAEKLRTFRSLLHSATVVYRLRAMLPPASGGRCCWSSKSPDVLSVTAAP